MINTEIPVNLKERIQVSPEVCPVLGGLVEMRSGASQAEAITARILNGDARRIVFAGEPGNGKTTAMSELVALTRQQSDILGTPIQPDVYFYDRFLAQEQKRKKKKTEKWDQHDWFDFNIHMFNALTKRPLSSASIQFIELPAVGDVGLKDRGVTALNMLADESKKNENDTLFIFLARNRAIQTKAAYIRGRAQQLRDEDVVSFLDSQDVEVRGVQDGRIAGAKIKTLFSKMGQKDHIDTIRKEELFKVSDWVSENKEEAARRMTGISDFPSLSGEEIHRLMVTLGMEFTQSRAMAENMSDDFLREPIEQAIYAEHNLVDNLGIPRENTFIVYNPFQNGRVVVDFSQFRKAA